MQESMPELHKARWGVRNLKLNSRKEKGCTGHRAMGQMPGSSMQHASENARQRDGREEEERGGRGEESRGKRNAGTKGWEVGEQQGITMKK